MLLGVGHSVEGVLEIGLFSVSCGTAWCIVQCGDASYIHMLTVLYHKFVGIKQREDVGKAHETTLFHYPKTNIPPCPFTPSSITDQKGVIRGSLVNLKNNARAPINLGRLGQCM